MYTISLFPMRILYVISDVFAFLLYYVFKYRRKVVKENIEKSFNGHTKSERIQIERDFYTNFCDNIVETIKLLSITEEELRKHIKADYTQLEKILKENQVCHIYLGHQFNWEWANAHLAASHKELNVVVVYKTLSNNAANNLMLNIRTRFGSKMIATKSMKKDMEVYSKEKHILVLVADQNPKIPERSFWTSFLSQRTPFLSGTELYTAHKKAPSLFANIIREGRGEYKFVLESLFNFSENYEMGTITKNFSEKLQYAILTSPQNYLWSHKRWKHEYFEEYNKRWIATSINNK
jgi:Kdo2-lipid IVA lauroyltransferase/acyltransferase